MIYNKISRLLVIGTILLFISCKSKNTDKSEPESTIRRSGDSVFVPTASSVMRKLSFDTVDAKDYCSQYTTTGIIRPLPGHLAEINTPFEGRVINSFVRLGDKVNKGTPVFSLSSADYLEAVKNFRESEKGKELAEKNYARKKELSDQGISSRKDLEDAAMNMEVAAKEYEKSRTTLQVFSVNPDEADLSKPLIIRSPIGGEIVRNDLTIGQYLKTESDPGIVVANLDRIWAVAHVKEKDLGNMSRNDKVEVVAEALPENPIGGTVNYIGAIMEDDTRSVEVYIECSNTERILKPGMFVTVRFYHNLVSAILVPSTAILQDEESSYLFVQKEPGLFLKRKVTVNSAENKNLLVRSGLEKGDVIITEGGIYLR